MDFLGAVDSGTMNGWGQRNDKRMLCRLAETTPDRPLAYDPKEARDLGAIIRKCEGWEYVDVKRTKQYGLQRCWQKKEDPWIHEEVLF